MAPHRHPSLPRVEDNKRDLDIFLSTLVRADIGFVLNQSGAVTTVELIVEPGAEKIVARPVFTFTKVGGAMRSFGLEPVTPL